jgi:hypothetical protein
MVGGRSWSSASVDEPAAADAIVAVVQCDVKHGPRFEGMAADLSRERRGGGEVGAEMRWGALARAALFGAIASGVAVGLAALEHPSSRAFLLAVFGLAWSAVTVWAYRRTGKE